MKPQWLAPPVTRIGRSCSAKGAHAAVDPVPLSPFISPRRDAVATDGQRPRWKQQAAGMLTLAILHGYLPTPSMAQADKEPSAPAIEAAVDDDPVKQAEAYGEQALAAYQRNEYSEAIALYLKAQELTPSAIVLYNVAKIYDLKIRDRELAMTFYRRYIADPGAAPDQVREANERLSRLRELDAAAATVPASETNAAAERPAAEQQADGNNRDPMTPAPILPSGEMGDDDGLQPLQIAGFVGGGLGVIGLGLGTAFALSARSKANDADCDGNACYSRGSLDQMNDAKRAATLSTVSTVAGLSFIAAGVLLYFVGGNDHDDEPKSVAALDLQPSVGPGYVGSQLTGKW